MRNSYGSASEAAREAWEARRREKEADNNAKVNPLLAGAFPMGKAMREGIDPPDVHEKDVLIKGSRHLIYGASGNGKTWLLLWLVMRALERGERVLYCDSEMGPRVVAERLADLGATPESIEAGLTYLPFPELSMRSAQHYEDALDELRPDLVAFDSFAAFLSEGGLDENSNKEVEDWSMSYLTSAKKRGITSIVVDHTPHETDRERGASRKREHVDVAWSVRQTRYFDRDTVGELTLSRKKDREAWLPLTVKFAVGGVKTGVMFRHSGGMAEATASEQGTAANVRGILVDRFGDAGATHTEWLNATEQLLDISKSTFIRRVRDLVDWCHVVKKEDRKYYPVTLKPEDEVSRDINSDTKADINANSDDYAVSYTTENVLTPLDTNTDTSRGVKVSAVPPPIGGNGGTIPDTDGHEPSLETVLALLDGHERLATLSHRCRQGGCDTDTLASAVASVAGWGGEWRPWLDPTMAALAELEREHG